jgi:hypothetical protein
VFRTPPTARCTERISSEDGCTRFTHGTTTLKISVASESLSLPGATHAQIASAAKPLSASETVTGTSSLTAATSASDALSGARRRASPVPVCVIQLMIAPVLSRGNKDKL